MHSPGIWKLVALMAAWTLAACGGGTPATPCTAGAIRPCSCPGGGSGSQACEGVGAQGTWAACRCTDSGTPMDASCVTLPLGSRRGEAVAMGTTVGAGNELAGSCGGGAAPDVAYLWTAPANGMYTISTRGSSFDTVLYALFGTCGGTPLVCVDDVDGGTQSEVYVNLNAGQSIVIVIDGHGTAEGSYVLNITGGPSLDDGGADAPGDVPCTPRDCRARGFDCDMADDGCGHPLDCGPCMAPATCGGGGLPNRCGSPSAATTCVGAGWCWENPLPSGVHLQGVHVVSPTFVWAVGDGGSIWRGDGTTWQSVPSGTGQRLYAVWASGPMDAWAAGDEVIQHWDGTRWTNAVSTPGLSYHAIWALAPNDVTVVGDIFQHWDGTVWRSRLNPTLQTLLAVHGNAADDIWAAGRNGTVLHWDGLLWRPVAVGRSSDLTGLWTLGTDVWFTTADGYVVQRMSGDRWVPVRTPARASETLQALYVLSPTDLWAAGGTGAASLVLHDDGTGWSTQPVRTTRTLRALSGPAGGLWAVGDYATRTHLDAGAWVNTDTPFFHGQHRLVAVHGSAADDVWTVHQAAGGPAMRWDGVRWTAYYLELPGGGLPAAVWTAGADDAWVAGGDTSTGWVGHWNGTIWTSSLTTGARVDGLGGAAAADLWAAGDRGLARHRVGTTWQDTTSGVTTTLSAVAAPAPGHAWAVGAGGVIRHGSGSAWAGGTSGVTADLAGVAGTAADDVWAVGRDGTVLHRGVSDWTRSTSGTDGHLAGVSARARDEAWAVGALAADTGAVIAGWDGTAWTAAPDGERDALLGVWAVGPGEAWAVGAGGTVLHRTSMGWAEQPVQWTEGIRDLFGVAGQRWALGEGAAMHWDGMRWRHFALSSTAAYRAGCAIDAMDAWAVGDGGALARWNGSRWATVRGPNLANLVGCWGATASDVWFVGRGGDLWHWDGMAVAEGMTLTTGSTTVAGILGFGAMDLWAYGSGGLTWHYDGMHWTERASPGPDVKALSATGPTALWALAAGTTGAPRLLQGDGMGWRVSPVALPTGLTAVRDLLARGPDDLWVVTSTRVLHWDGIRWTDTVPSLPGSTLETIYGEAAGGVWVGGAGGTLLRRER